MTDVITFKTQHDAGRQTLGTTAPTPPPVMLGYLYRAFMPQKTNGGSGALLKYTYRAFVFPGTKLPDTYHAFVFPPTRPYGSHGQFAALPPRSPNIPPIIQ